MHAAVGRVAAAEMMPPHDPRKSAALADADHIDLLTGLELVDQHFVARFEIVVARPQPELPHELRALDAGLFQMPRHRLINSCRLHELEQSELHRIVAVRSGRLALHHHARPGLQQRDRNPLPVREKDLLHTDFFAKYSWTHEKTSESGVRRRKSE